MTPFPPLSEFAERIRRRSTAADVARALHAPKLDPDGLAALLSPAADACLPQLAACSKELTRQRFGNAIQLYAPSISPTIARTAASTAAFPPKTISTGAASRQTEAESEAAILLQRGFHHILLVSGESEKILGVDYLEEIAQRLRRKFASISIEVQPLTLPEYRRLFRAGITSVAVYQETYDRDLYRRLHLAGKKCDFDYRLDTPARVCEAGMREIGIGALLGLSDWRAEGLALGYHLYMLRRRFWKTAVTVSFPRMRPAAGEFEPLDPVSERDLSHLMFALRLFDPDVCLLLSTREEPSFRDGMLGLGPTRYSAGSCTAPGGYSSADRSGAQFEVGDHRSLEEVCRVIRAKGLDPVHKDWDAEFQSQATAV